MKELDLKIVNGHLATTSGVFKADIGINGGKITCIGEWGSLSGADFAIFDFQEERDIKLDEQLGLEWTLYEGMKAVYPDLVLVRGKTVVKGGEVVGARGYGEFCSPSL